MSQLHDRLQIKPIAGRIGAEIDNVRLSSDLDGVTIASIEAALLKHKVIFVRNQHHLDDAAQEAFAARFGELVPHPTNKTREGSRALLELDSSHGGGRANHWHTDVTFTDAYPKISVLRGVVIPPVGGDTVWANTVTAYEDLPASLKALADGLWALHTNEYDYAGTRPNASAEAIKYFEEVFTATVYETAHPVVRVHPKTGERSLVLGGFVRKLIGMNQADSDRLYEVLQSHVVRLDNTVRWRWRAGDVAIWDNRATQHYAINDYGDQKRIVRRATLVGEIPVSIDGRTSVAKSKTTKAPRLEGVAA